MHDPGLYHVQVHLLTILLSLFSGEIRRCALPYLSQSAKFGQPQVAKVASRQMASSLSTFETEHFVFWWSMQDLAHRIQGIPGEDSGGVPKLVRVAADGLEKAWRGYVDTLKYLPPKASATTRLWGVAVPAGKYPVEICNVGVALNDDTSAYFGVAYPEGALGRSTLMLASDIQNFGRWQMTVDLTGRLFTMDYSVDWREAIRATAVHELFHAVQFNYELALDQHGFFEASAVAMESRMEPESSDYLQYAKSLCDLKSLVPFPTGVGNSAYPQGWFVRTMMMDLGTDVVKGLWESRKATAKQSVPFLSTMRQILPNYPGGSFDSLLIHQAARVALTGKRSTWVSPEVVLFPDAADFPILTGALTSSDSLKSLGLSLGAIQALIDTVAYGEDRLMVWIPDEGVAMGHAVMAGGNAKVSWEAGSVRVPSNPATRSTWVFANPGNPVALRPYATSEASTSYFQTLPAPVRTAAHAGQSWSWTSPDGLVVSGTSRTETRSTPLLHLDVWKPSASKDPFAARMAGGSSGHAVVLEDADHSLSLSGATLRWDGGGIVSAYQGAGDGVWRNLVVSGGAVRLDELDLSRPTRILLSGSGPAKASSRLPRPNPSRQSEPIHFPISGAIGSETLTILSADGGIVRELQPAPNQTEVVWDLRNRENRQVRPGVYTWLWRGVEGQRQGRLLVAD